MNLNQKIIALDIWTKRIWVSFWETEFGVAFLDKTLSRDDLVNYITIKRPDIIVVWIPQVNEWQLSKSRHYACSVLDELKAVFTSVKFVEMDERMTTILASSKVKEMWLSDTKRKDLIDSLSAQILLQNYFRKIWK